MSLRPCSRRGDGSLPPRQIPLPALGPLGLALIIPKLCSMAPPIVTCYLSTYLCYQRHSTCMFNFFTLSQGFQRFVLQTGEQAKGELVILVL